MAVSLAIAGNQKMVEQRVQELDELNKSALEFVPDKPKDGKIILKTYIRNDKNKLIKYQVVEGEDRQTTKQGTIVFEGGKLP